MSKENSSSPWDDILVAPTSAESRILLLKAYRRYSDELSNKDIDSQLTGEMTRQSFLAALALKSTEASHVLYRKNPEAHEIKIQAWLSEAVFQANRISFRTETKFNGLSVGDLKSLVPLTLSPDRIGELPEILSRRFGIILVIQPGYPAMKMDGCALMLAAGKPMIGISLRYNRYDNFWFTLFHELSHICLHLDHLDTPIVDDLDEEANEDIETEANILARDSFVPRREWRVLYEKRHDENFLKKTCRAIEAHPDIVAGLIRYAAGNYKLYPNQHSAIDVRQILGFKNV